LEWLKITINLNDIFQKMVPHLSSDQAGLAQIIKESCSRIWNVYGCTESPAVLEEAVLAFQMAVDYTPETSADLPLYLIRLGICLEDRAKSKNEPQGLDRAITVYKRAIQHTPSGTQQLPRNLNTLALAQSMRYYLLGDLDDLRQSIDTFKEAVRLSAKVPADQLIYLKNMSSRLEELYAATKDPKDLQALADCHSAILAHVSDDSNSQIDSYGKLGFCWMEKHGYTDDPADLDRAIEQYEKAAALVAEPGARHSLFLAAGSARFMRFQKTREEKDLEMAASQFEEADRRSPGEAPEKAGILNNAGAANIELYELRNELQFLDRGIGFINRILHLRKPELQADYSAKLAELYRKRYERTQDHSDLRAVVDTEAQSLETFPEESAEREYLLIKICGDCALLYDRSESKDDLEGCIRYSRALASQTSKADLQLLGMSFLGDFLLRRYRLTSEKTDLDDALETIRKAVALCPDDSPLKASISASLGSVLGHLYEKTGLGQYQQESAQILEGLRKRVHAGEKADKSVFTTLGHFLCDRFASFGALCDLEDALEYRKKALAADEKAGKAPGLYTNLGNTLSDLYSATGNLQRLNEALEAWGEAVRLSNPSSPYHATRLNNLGSGWLSCYQHSHDPQDLDAAVDIIHKSVDLTDPGSINLPIHLSYLGESLIHRYTLSGNIEDLKEAVEAFKKGISLSQPGTTAYQQLSTLLGQNLRLLFEATGRPELLSLSLETLQRSLDTMQPSSDFYPAAQAFLGADYEVLHQQDKHEESRKLMQQHYRNACQHGIPLRLNIVLNCSQWWGNCAMAEEEWAEAAEAFGYGVQALGRLYQAQVLRSDKETWLSEAQRIHSLAAYALARADQIAEAVEVIEKGRARLLMELLERHRAELKRLSELGYAEIFRQYSQAVDHLAYLEKSELQTKPAASRRDIVGEIQSAHQQLDAAVNAIQQIPGCEHLFATSSFKQVLDICEAVSAETGQPPLVIYLLLTSAGGLAIVLDNGKHQAVRFELTEADLDQLLIEKEGEKVTGGYLSVQFAAHSGEAVLGQVLETLGSKMMQPIAAHLADAAPSAASNNPRTLILVPTGRLSLFPLHAIPWKQNGAGQTLLDQFDVTFIPSLRALSHCLKKKVSLSAEVLVLSAVGNPLPVPDGLAPLTFARPEVDEIARQFPGEKTLLCEDKATLSDVEKGMNLGMYLHFSCHGMFDPEDPMLSGILLSGGERFTLRNLVTRPELGKARLAVLSACQTAITEFNKLPEEAIGLPSGFLQAGLPGVVGSLWPVHEISTALLMIRFYQYHLIGDPFIRLLPVSPIRALRQAQLWLRGLTNANLADWFAACRKAAAKGQSGIPQELAQEQFRSFALRPPGEHPYSHPYYWAGFAFFGI
jgi:CHAT domain-containing protein/exonuclease VII small subunit